jgi:hypothetical protein
MFPSPTRMFLTKGVGVHRHALTAFEFALRDADIEQQKAEHFKRGVAPQGRAEGRGRQQRGGTLKMSWTKPWPRRPLWGLNCAAGLRGRGWVFG